MVLDHEPFYLLRSRYTYVLEEIFYGHGGYGHHICNIFWQDAHSHARGPQSPHKIPVVAGCPRVFPFCREECSNGRPRGFSGRRGGVDNVYDRCRQLKSLLWGQAICAGWCGLQASYERDVKSVALADLTRAPLRCGREIWFLSFVVDAV